MQHRARFVWMPNDTLSHFARRRTLTILGLALPLFSDEGSIFTIAQQARVLRLMIIAARNPAARLQY